MLRMRTEARHGLRWGLFALATAMAILAVSSDPVDARSRRKHVSHRHGPAVTGDEPRYAAIVVDGNSGNVLHAANPDALRHPASLTKIMTLYLLFERLDSGKLKLDSQLRVSDRAAEQSPTKLGLKDGQTIEVEDAIKGIVTRSANDAAVVVAENIAGDEGDFARMMTRKAQALGMSRTVYRNASGLPDDSQVTTARDQAILGRAIQERFPRYYRYFSTRSFTFRGETIANHNHLLGRVEGVDGIKTGYVSASGFNLVTSVHRGNRYLVAVVMGGSSAGSRDERMRSLISDHIASASTQRTAPMLAEAADKSDSKIEAKIEAKIESKSESKSDSKPASPGYALASASSSPRNDPPATAAIPAQRAAAAVPTPRAAPGAGSTDPIRPVVVKTLTVKPASVQTASMVPLQMPSPASVAEALSETPTPPTPTPPTPTPPPAATPPAAVPVKAEAPVPPPGARPGILGVLPARTVTASVAETVPAPSPPAAPSAAPAPIPAAIPAPNSLPNSLPNAAPAPSSASAAPPTKPLIRSGWIIQVGAYTAEDEAKQRLSSVQSKAARLLAAADPFTESVLKGDTTYYRARFAGLDKEKAEAACKYLKRNDVDCISIKN
jgi:D-alanyl-D-alanine carboxypeptidase